MLPGRKPSPSEKAMSYFLSNSQISSKCVYRKFCFLLMFIHLARIDPPRETIPVTRFKAAGKCS